MDKTATENPTPDSIYILGSYLGLTIHAAEILTKTNLLRSVIISACLLFLDRRTFGPKSQGRAGH